jgi:hypothetical protein
MANSIINSDDGSVSGISGLKTTGGDDGVLKIQTNGTDAVSVSSAQVCTFPNPPVMGVSGLTGDIAAARITNALNASGSAPIYAARAWVNFDGTTSSPSTIFESGNVSSVTKNGTGRYTLNFTTAMPDANYCGAGSALGQTTAGGFVTIISTTTNSQTTKSTTQAAFTVATTGGTAVDVNNVGYMILR